MRRPPHRRATANAQGFEHPARTSHLAVRTWMSTERPSTVPTGVEPIDQALGGLEPGRVHVVYGELGAGKTALAMQFLVEGLRAGETCALVLRDQPDEAIKRIAFFGYDCVEDLRSGRLLMLEYAADLVEQLTRLDDFSEVLAEFGWMIGEARPSRIVFDSADYIFSIQQGYGHALQISALVTWLAESGAVTLLVVEERAGDRIVQSFRVQARTVIHAMKRSVGAETEFSLAFEKGPVKAPQRIVALTPQGLQTTSEIDAKAKTRPLASPAAPELPPVHMRTGQLSTPEEAQRIIAEAAKAATPSQLPPPPAQPAPQPMPPRPLARAGRPRVLVIDDDPIVCGLVARALEADCEVEAAGDGVAGLARLLSFDPDVVLLDVTLPIVDGLTVCRQMRANSSVPIVIISGTHTTTADRITSAEIGADAFLTKPFSLQELRARVGQLVARYRGERPVPSRQKSAGDPLVPMTRFYERVELQADLARVGVPASVVGCRIETNGSVETGRIIDTVRHAMRPDDVVAFDPDTHHLVALAPMPAEAAEALARRLEAQVREHVGMGIAFWTMPVLGAAGNTSRALTERFVRSRADRGRARREFLEFIR